jgi:hypothetical protein
MDISPFSTDIGTSSAAHDGDGDGDEANPSSSRSSPATIEICLICNDVGRTYDEEALKNHVEVYHHTTLEKYRVRRHKELKRERSLGALE